MYNALTHNHLPISLTVGRVWSSKVHGSCRQINIFTLGMHNIQLRIALPDQNYLLAHSQLIASSESRMFIERSDLLICCELLGLIQTYRGMPLMQIWHYGFLELSSMIHNILRAIYAITPIAYTESHGIRCLQSLVALICAHTHWRYTILYTVDSCLWINRWVLHSVKFLGLLLAPVVTEGWHSNEIILASQAANCAIITIQSSVCNEKRHHAWGVFL